MQELINVIGAAIAADATKEQKESGVQACRTILTALDCEPGQPLVLPGAPRPHVLTGVSIDQVLELAIARLSALATDRANGETNASSPVTTNSGKTPTAQRPPVAQGLRVPLATLPSAPTVARAAPSKTKAANPVTRSAQRKV